jgi:hypothetical protein
MRLPHRTFGIRDHEFFDTTDQIGHSSSDTVFASVCAVGSEGGAAPWVRHLYVINEMEDTD